MSSQPSTSQQIDPEVRRLFWSALDGALEDKETKESLEKLADSGLDVSVEKIRADVIEATETVIERCQTMLSGWQGAKLRQEEAKAERRRRLRAAFSMRLLVIAAIGALTSYLVLPSSLGFFSAFILVAPILPVYSRMLENSFNSVQARAEAEARERLEAALQTQTTVAVREAINRRLTSYSTDFRIFDRRGLRQLADPDREVSTAAVAELETLIASLDSGSIGLSGPRGCGKTTLINSFADGPSMPFNKERIGLTVAAPVKYDAHEFVLHLFSSLCERVLRDRPDDLARSGSRWARARLWRVVLWLGIAALGLIAAGLVLVIDPQPPDRNTVGIALLILGGIAAYLWLFVFLEATSWGKEMFERLGAALGLYRGTGSANGAAEQMARDYLKQIRFQQSHDAGRTAEIKLPLGLGLGGSSTTTLARTPWTLPEAVDEFRRFAAILSNRFVVIGIDELDKMESDEAAREFLNNIKGVFGVAGCYFLVSVSEDAMSAFERRGLPLRDVFDSSFDEIQRIGYLDLDESRMVLESRVTGVPVPFQCLCHCLAGGLPRDLIRVTRELVHHFDVAQGELEADVSLQDLTSSLIEVEWRGKLAGAIAAGRGAVHSQPWWLTRWLHAQAQEELCSDSLQERTLELSDTPGVLDTSNDDDEDAHRAQRIAIEMMAFNYYAATALELFGGDGAGGMLRRSWRAQRLSADSARTVERLAMARQQFSIDPWLAWGLVEEARTADGLAPWQDLRPTLA